MLTKSAEGISHWKKTKTENHIRIWWVVSGVCGLQAEVERSESLCNHS